jgi:amidase
MAAAHTRLLLLRQPLAQLQRLPAVTRVRESLRCMRVLNPLLNAVIFPRDENDALRAAAAVDGDSEGRGSSRRPLAGMPFTVKDVIEVEGYPCTLGSVDLQASSPGRFAEPRRSSAPVVRALEAAGAVLVGKVNVPERGLDVQTANPLFGTTNNPWALERTPGGSSGACAACVAAGISPLSVGSDLAGSLRIPAAYCGVASLRPTPLRYSGAGHEPPAYRDDGGCGSVANDPVAESSLVLGPIAADVATLEAFLQVVTAGAPPPLPPPSPASASGAAARRHSPGPYITSRLDDRAGQPGGGGGGGVGGGGRLLRLGFASHFSAVGANMAQVAVFQQVRSGKRD